MLDGSIMSSGEMTEEFTWDEGSKEGATQREEKKHWSITGGTYLVATFYSEQVPTSITFLPAFSIYHLRYSVYNTHLPA